MILLPVILSGGSGTRLWPLSRTGYPKQFMDLGGRTLFGDTLERAMALPDVAMPLVICNESHRFMAAAALQRHDRQARILLEPVPRNTAPAIALAALAALELHGEADPLLLVLPSDHTIHPQEKFTAAVAEAARSAEQGHLATFGVPPTRPETGFGYIRRGDVVPGGYKVAGFVEKPDAEHARDMLATGDCYWNSGMFLFRASTYLRELESHAPAIAEACRKAWAGRATDHDFVRMNAEAFGACPSDSIDYAVMEHTDRACVVPLEAAWNDLGSWSALYDSAPHDAEGNACTGDIVTHDARNCYLHGSHRLVTALGVEGLAVVETADAVLVADKSRTQEVKTLLQSLKARKRPETEHHTRVLRPWGSYEVLAQGERFQVKRIIVGTGQVLSLQLHHHRAEHWVVVRGTARVTVGEEVMLLHEDQSTYIPLGTVHRLENPGKIPLEIVEIQSGVYLGEDDIVRLEDTYGRLPR